MNTPKLTIDKYGNQEWYLNGKLHREDGPAVIWPDGTQYWYLNGICHKKDGPAVIWANGTKYWYLNGKYHREDGPAIIRKDGTLYWYLNDKKYLDKKQYQNAANLSDEDMVVLLLKYTFN